MIVKKKKAQTALEILVIFGILIVGAIIFALFYSTNIEKKLDTSSNIQGTYSDIENNLQSNDPQQPIETCGNDFCGPGENCIGCPDDCDCTNCPLTAPTLQITPEPITGVPAGAPGHNTFNLQIAVMRQSEFSGKTIKIKKVIFNESQTDVFYKGQTQIPITGLEINQEMVESTPGNFLYNITNLSSTKSGVYVIKVFAEVSGCDLNSEAKTMITIKGLSANLSLSPDGTSNRDEPFGVDINVNNYNSDSNVSITKIYVLDTNNTLLDNVCSYNGNLISSSGQVVNILMNKIYNDYNYSFKNTFSCKYSGQYKLMFTLHDNDENTDYDYNATIEKSIKDRCLYLGNIGDGTESKPYVISNPEDLDCIRYNLSKHFKLGNNIDLNHTTLSSNDQYYWYDDTKGWNPIGTLDAAFTGSFDGNGKTISNLYSRRNYYVGDCFGLFRKAEGSTFSNLNLTGVDIDSNVLASSLVFSASDSNFTNINIEGNIRRMAMGGFVASSFRNIFRNCSFTGTLKGIANVGGIAGEGWSSSETGHNRSDFYDCVVDANISGDNYMIADEDGDGIDEYIPTDSAFLKVGGIFGAPDGAIIDNCTVTGNFKSQGDTGGLIGHGSADISNSHFIGSIRSAVWVGGLIGSGRATITDSYAIVDITSEPSGRFAIGAASVPGFWGGLGGQMRGNIVNSYAIVNMLPHRAYYSGDEPNMLMAYNNLGYMGGLIGWSDDSNIINSYSKGDIILNDSGITAGRDIGGLTGVLQDMWPPLGSKIMNSYSMVNITINGGGDEVGGMFGIISNGFDANNNYSIGNISVTGTKTKVGGLIGRKGNSTVNNSYWNIQTSGQSSSAGGFPRTTAQMTYPYDSNTYVDWDFSNVWEEDTENTNGGYPYLLPPSPPEDLRGGPAPKSVEEGGGFFHYVLISEDGNILDYGVINN